MSKNSGIIKVLVALYRFWMYMQVVSMAENWCKQIRCLDNEDLNVFLTSSFGAHFLEGVLIIIVYISSCFHFTAS